MNFTLKNTDFEADGIFGILTAESGQQYHTLQHAYDSGQGNGSYTPKLQPGIYTCRRSLHRLHGMDHDFETFQVMDVPGHSNILLHWGNYNKDSEGCILLGRKVTFGPGGIHMITDSRTTFADFMKTLDSVDSFTLTVE